ncbi:MAG: oligosaccharide flippase family protein, partial [Methanomassiliicoccales archaeon]
MKKGKFALLDKFVFALVGFVYVFLSARLISIEEFGSLMISLSIFWFITVFSDAGIGNALIKYAAEEDGDGLKKVITNSLFIKMCLSLILSIACVLMVLPLSYVFGSTALKTNLLFLP